MICPINSFYKDDSKIDRFIEENFFKEDKKNTDKSKPLFKKILKLKINTVILSPKDDNKHLRKMYITGSNQFDKDLRIKTDLTVILKRGYENYPYDYKIYQSI